MPLKSVSLECVNDDCTAHQRGERRSDFFRVDLLDELTSGTVVDELCQECGQQLRVAFSGCRIGRSGKPQSEEPKSDSHRHLYMTRVDDLGTEAVFSLATGKGLMRTQFGSKTHRELMDRGVQSDACILTPIPPVDGKNPKDLN